MRILYVEDHAIFAGNVVREFLSAHSVTVVPGIASARRALTGGPFDLVLLDYDLEDGKGDELVEELRSAKSALKIVAVSSHDAGNSALFNAGADAICGKMQFDQIQATINSLIPPSTSTS